MLRWIRNVDRCGGENRQVVVMISRHGRAPSICAWLLISDIALNYKNIVERCDLRFPAEVQTSPE